MSDQVINPAERTSEAPIEPPHVILQEVAAALDRARFEARQCRTATLEARANFARCLSAWNASGPAPMTQSALMKQHIDSNQRERAKRYAAGQGVHYPGVGRTAKALAGGNARNGGGASYRRGAYTRAEAMTANNRAAAMARAKAAFKTPSQR
jgi:hypothetical protein